MKPSNPRIFLDYNAKAPLRPEALTAYVEAAHLGNPSSIHGEGRDARVVLEKNRKILADLVDCSPGEMIFTSGGSESNALALHGGNWGMIYASAAEHDSILKQNDLKIIPIDASGQVDLDHLESCLKETHSPKLVSVMMANNETGVLSTLEPIVALARRHNAFVHTDAAQALGRTPLSFKKLGVDMMTLSSTKVGGPAGVGALIVREGISLTPMILGGAQEQRRRAGTENVPGIAGFATAATSAVQSDPLDLWKTWQHQLEKALLTIPGVTLYGQNTPRLPNTLCFGREFCTQESIVIGLDLEGISIGAGSACSSGKISPSHVLSSMSVSPVRAKEAIRISFGWNTLWTELEIFLEKWTTLSHRLVSTSLHQNC